MAVQGRPAPRFVLASASPRRRELLAQLGAVFTVCEAGIDEDAVISASEKNASLPVAARTLLLARSKAADILHQQPDAIVLGADTTVALDAHRDLGKPRDAAEARCMLRTLSGRSHEVITGVVLLDGASGRETSIAVRTRVRMRRYGEETIRRYVATGEPMDKAGAYAIQGLGALLVRGIRGSYSNVVGLPLESLESLFSDLGYSVWDYVL